MSNLNTFLYADILCKLHRIIRSFEGIIDALVNKENFTNVKLVKNDIALIGERVSYFILKILKKLNNS